MLYAWLSLTLGRQNLNYFIIKKVISRIEDQGCDKHFWLYVYCYGPGLRTNNRV